MIMGGAWHNRIKMAAVEAAITANANIRDGGKGGVFCPETSNLGVFELKFIADYFRIVSLDFKGENALVK
jgi:hypothetical protein